MLVFLNCINKSQAKLTLKRFPGDVLKDRRYIISVFLLLSIIKILYKLFMYFLCPFT